MANVLTLFKRIVAVVLVALILATCLFVQTSAIPANGKLALFFARMEYLFLSSKTQWITYACLCFYVGILGLVDCRTSRLRFWRLDNYAVWGFLLVTLISLEYLRGYLKRAPSSVALVLLTSFVVGRALTVWQTVRSGCAKEGDRQSILISMVVLLSISFALGDDNGSSEFFYVGRKRWSGVWDGPNMFGLLMGTGMALALGIVSSVRSQVSGAGFQSKVGVWLAIAVCGVAAVLMGRGLLHSYSRGAWVATLCGLAYLACHGLAISRAVWFRKNLLSISMIILSVVVIASWHFRHTEWHPVRRAFSVANINDFSWRNRIAAYEGALQMMASKPLLGFGWNQPEGLYQHYYLAPSLTESAAIQMNDYLMLGTTLGIPALVCFLAYVGLSLCRGSRVERREMPDAHSTAPGLSPVTLHLSLAAICRAGAIVLLVGFWFDGGLFKLATGAMFWILLEFGRIEGVEPVYREKHQIGRGL